MAHEVETMAYAGKLPWHGLGKKVNHDLSSDEMLNEAGLNWEVRKRPLYMPVSDNKFRRVERYALTRETDEKVLTYCGKDWHPFQNREALDFFKAYAEAGKVRLETAGSLRGGQIIWALANIQHQFDAGAGDKVNGYLLLTSPHTVGTCISVRTTSIRVVCANTLSAAESQTQNIHWRQNHRKQFDVEGAMASVELAHDYMSQQETAARRLKLLKLSDEDAGRFYAKFFQDGVFIDLEPANMNKKMQQVWASYHNAPGAEIGTGWGVLNGITHWSDHVAGRQSDARLSRSWFGENHRIKLKAQQELLNMAA